MNIEAAHEAIKKLKKLNREREKARAKVWANFEERWDAKHKAILEGLDSATLDLVRKHFESEVNERFDAEAKRMTGAGRG